jgi:small subunit ribosomal protein S4
MVISLKESSKKIKAVQEAVQSPSRSVPGYYEVLEGGFAGKLLALPSMADISLPLEINIPMICDFLAHGA